MADISFLVNGITFTFAEGEVKEINTEITTNIEPVTISVSGPSATYVYDYDGCRKEITLVGILFATGTSRVSGYSIDTIIEQKQWLESLANGNQSPIQFSSNYESLSVLSTASLTLPYNGSFSNTYVKIVSINFREMEGLVNELPFTIKMVVGQ